MTVGVVDYQKCLSLYPCKLLCVTINKMCVSLFEINCQTVICVILYCEVINSPWPLTGTGLVS